MGSKGVGSIFIFSLNLLFVSTLVFAKPSPRTPPPPRVTCPSTPPPVVAPSTPPPVIAPSTPPPVVAPTTPPRNCQILNLGVCANVLNLVNVAINPETNSCCTLISGLVDLEASVCLCAAINANVLGLINLDVNVALGIILNRCGRTRPTNFICSAPSTPPHVVAPSTPPPVVAPSTPPPVVAPSTPPPMVAPSTPPQVIAPSTPPPVVAPTTPPRNCQILNLGVCANVLNLVNVAINPETNSCCTLISGLVDLEASVCLCAAINANVLGLINLDVNVALGIILNRCGRTRPTNFICSAPSTPPPMVAPSTPPPMVAPSTPPPVVAPSTPPPVIAPSTPPPMIAPTTPPRNCQNLNLNVCANVLNLVNVAINPRTNSCCTLIRGLVDLDASVCLCAAINANVLGLINLDVNVALGIILNRCERTRPTNFICRRT